ncbi:hypothetical protein F5Y03DRAFT_394447 [Xylaria venustula]|nr:hypothetical protein F5Y03DRAFT_394447 [Xylaria venustula]
MFSNSQLQRRKSALQAMPIELILKIASDLNSPQEMLNFSMACPPYLDHWLHLSRGGPINAAGVRLFQEYSVLTMRRFSQRKFSDCFCLFSSCRILQIGYMTSTFVVRILNPLWDIIQAFATDFAKKSLSNNHNLAHHAPPSFAHESMNMPGQPDFHATVYYRDTSRIQDLSQLHETERERIMLAFYQYEATCVTSAKISGYWEIRRAVDGQERRLNGWNEQRVLQSPLAGQSLCQIERVRCVYNYVRLQYLIIFNQLWIEYRERLETTANYARENNIFDGEDRPWGPLVPDIFADGDSMVEWIDILCSKGLAFLHEVLSMDKRRRREFFCQTYYPTRVSSPHFVGTEEYLVNGIFYMLERREALTDLNWSDALENAGAANLAWVQFNNLGDGSARSTFFSSEILNNLRREGWVFWNADRCMERELHQRIKMECKAVYQPQQFYYLPNFFDQHTRMGRVQGGQLYPALLDKIWLKAGQPFTTPASRPSIVEFGVQGERWRLGEEVDKHGEPILPSYDYTRTHF